MTITEPTTMLTDYLVAVASVVWAVLLWRRRADESRAVRWWAVGFGCAAVAALAGGTVHGFRLHLGAAWEAALWRLTLIAIGAYAFCALATALAAGARPPARTAGMAIGALLLAGYAALVWIDPRFVWAIAVYAPALLILLVQQWIARARRGAPSAPWIAAGVLVSFVAAAIQRSGLDLHRHFNHNDLYHVVQLAGGWLLYRGGLLLEDWREA